MGRKDGATEESSDGRREDDTMILAGSQGSLPPTDLAITLFCSIHRNIHPSIHQLIVPGKPCFSKSGISFVIVVILVVPVFDTGGGVVVGRRWEKE